MDLNELKTLERRVMRELSKSTGKPLSKKEIATRLKVTPTAVAKALKVLTKASLATVKKVGNVKLSAVEINIENFDAARFKRTDNLQQIYDSGLAREIIETHPGTAIVLFGSYERGEDTFQSDIDIAVIGDERKIALEKFEKFLTRRINIIYFRKISGVLPNLRANIMNGFVIHGHIS